MDSKFLLTLLFSIVFFAKIQGEELKGVHISPSLFPNIGSPTIKFVLNEEDHTPILENTTVLWRVGDKGILKDVIEEIVVQNGLTLTKKRGSRWVGQWIIHKVSKHPGYKELKSFQKTNRIPGFNQLGNKENQFKNIRELIRSHGWTEFPFVFPAFILPNDLKTFRTACESSSQKLWIVKPPLNSCSVGIRMLNQCNDTKNQEPTFIQKYLENPYLIEGRKVELRFYFVVTSISPLRIYSFKESCNRLGFMEYTTDPTKINHPCLHFRNYYNGIVDDCGGTLLLKEFQYPNRSRIFKYLEKDGINPEEVIQDAHNGIILSVLSAEEKILKNIRNEYSNKGFQFLSADFILDENGKPWLLEINSSPTYRHLSYRSETFVTVLNLAGFRLANETRFSPKLYKYELTQSERKKQRKFVQQVKTSPKSGGMDTLILESLTTDDVRQLMIAEDELSRMGDYGVRIYPSENMGQYNKFISSDSNVYYGQLFTAWEEMYGMKRQSGIERLSNLSKNLFH